MGFWPVDCFKGKIVLIIGGTSGIGAAIARAFVVEGASVTVTGITTDEASKSRVSLPGADARALDVRDTTAIQELIAGFEALDHVINCAGMIRRGAEHNLDIFDDVIDVNLIGTMRICTAARPILKSRRGTIVNIASVLSYFGGGLVPGYSASKGGVAQLTKSLAIAYAEDGIRVNALAPGWIATPMTQALQDNPERNMAILSRTPLKRWGSPDDLAGGALFLSSPVAAFVTGTVLVVDGGYMAT
jgi:NAD(P)-dependent dehydrogenase (short-subunit alcohol dehydrogenase family)